MKIQFLLSFKPLCILNATIEPHNHTNKQSHRDNHRHHQLEDTKTVLITFFKILNIAYASAVSTSILSSVFSPSSVSIGVGSSFGASSAGFSSGLGSSFLGSAFGLGLGLSCLAFVGVF